MKKAKLTIGILILLVSSSTYGAALGQAKRTSMLGYSIGATMVSVDDPAGDTEATWIIQPISLVYTARLWKDSVRYWSEFYYYQAALDATPSKIGQDAKRYGLRLSFQKNLPINPKFSAWFGAGLDMSQEKFTNRHSVDTDGFLTALYPDREETTLAGVVNVVGEWPLTREWIIAAKLEQSIPISGYLKESLAAVTLLYRY